MLPSLLNGELVTIGVCCERVLLQVYTDMCEICNVVTTLYTDTDAWITCDVCDKWYHQKCAGVSPDATSFTCPTCSNGTIAAAGSGNTK